MSGGEFARHHYAVDVLRPQGVRCQSRHQCRIDAAGEADDCLAYPGAGEIVTYLAYEKSIDGFYGDVGLEYHSLKDKGVADGPVVIYLGNDVGENIGH